MADIVRLSFGLGYPVVEFVEKISVSLLRSTATRVMKRIAVYFVDEPNVDGTTLIS